MTKTKTTVSLSQRETVAKTAQKNLKSVYPTFGKWRVTRGGLVNGSYKIDRRTLWDGLGEDQPEHDQWEYHIKGKVGFDYDNFLKALSAARRIHAAYRPAGVQEGSR